jgi:crotonobetainyl-CoA:carnitine CoA-transferase CaiB-like acyl-CoA transferase
MSQKAVRNVPGYILAILDGRFALPEQEAKARFRRELERSREENEQREAEAQKRKAERRHRKGVVDAWIVEHPEEYAAILAKKRQKVPEVLTGKSAEDLAERWARNRVYEVATMLAPTMVTSDVKLPSEKRTGACPSRNT